MTSDNEKKTLNNVFPSPPPFPLVSGHRLFWISWWCYWWAGQWHNKSIVGMFLKFTSRVLFLCLAHVFFLNFFIAQMKVLGQFKKTLSFTFEWLKILRKTTIFSGCWSVTSYATFLRNNTWDHRTLTQSIV